MNLYAPTDIDACHEAWGANCGPVALAAILRREVAEVRRLMPLHFADRQYMGGGHMVQALMAAKRMSGVNRDNSMPLYGVSLLQFDGPWCNEGVPVRVRCCYRHWIASARWRGEHDTDAIYDINARCWMDADCWWEEWVPKIAASYRRASGVASVCHSLEVEIQ